MISNQSEIDPKAEIDEGVTIGPWCIVGPGVRIGSGTVIESHVVIRANTVIGTNNRFYQFCSVGEDPADKKFEGEETWLKLVTTMCSGKGSRCIEGPVPEEGIPRSETII